MLYCDSTSGFDLPRPLRRNLHVILYQATEFRPNRSTHCGNMASYPFLKMAPATAKYYFRFRICWCHCLQKVKVYQQTKFRPDISIDGWDITTSGFEIQTSAILEFYFWFWPLPFPRNQHIILHPAAEFRPKRYIRRWNMTWYQFSGWRPSAMLYLLWGNGGPSTKCLSWSEFRPQIASLSDKLFRRYCNVKISAFWLETAYSRICGKWCRHMALRNRELHARNDDDDDSRPFLGVFGNIFPIWRHPSSWPPKGTSLGGNTLFEPFSIRIRAMVRPGRVTEKKNSITKKTERCYISPIWGKPPLGRFDLKVARWVMSTT